MPTASVPGRNDVELEPQMLDVEKYIARVEPLFSKVFTKQKSRGAPNNLAESLTFGAHTNRVTIRAIPSHSCAASTVFSFLMTASAGGSCPFTGSTRARNTKSRKNISSRNLGAATADRQRFQCRVRAPNAFTSFANLSSIPGTGCGAYRSRMYVSAICRMRLDSLGSD